MVVEKRWAKTELEAIAAILVRAQLAFGAAGLILAAALAGWLIGFGVPPFASSPGLALLGAALVGALLGLKYGGPAGALPRREAEREASAGARRYHQYQ